MFDSPEAAREAFDQANRSPGVLAGLKVAEEAVRQFPQSALAHALKAKALTATGEREKAAEVVSAALALQALDPDALAIAIALALYAGDSERAEAILAESADVEPNRALTAARAEFYMMTGDNDRALEYISILVAEYPDVPPVHALVANCGFATAEMLEASLRKLREDFPDRPTTLAIQARIQGKQNNLVDAESLIRRALEIAPESPTWLAQLSNYLFAQGKHDEAKQAAQSALDLNRLQPTAWRTLAKVARERGQSAEAESYDHWADEAIPLLKDFAIVQKANALIAQAQWRQAISVLAPLESAKISHVRKTAQTIQARCLLRVGTETELTAILPHLDSAQAVHYAVRASIAQRQKRSSDGAAVLEEALEKFPTSGLIASLLLYALRRDHQTVRARVMAERLSTALMGNPTDAMLVYYALLKLGYRNEVEECQRGTRRLFPNYPGWRLADSIAYLSEGYYDQAEEIASSIRGTHGLAAQQVADRARRLNNWTNPKTWFRRRRR